jgi:hypothetical protein
MELESFQKSQPSPLGVLDALRNFTRYVHCVIQIIAQVSCIMSFIEGGSVTKMNNRHVFFVRAHCGSLVLSLTRGPAGERTTTGSQSAPSRTARHQLSHNDGLPLTFEPCPAVLPACHFVVSTLRAHSPQLQHRGKGHDGRALFFDCKEKHRKLLDWIIKTV